MNLMMARRVVEENMTDTKRETKEKKKNLTVINQKLIHQPRKAPQRKPNQERRNHKTKKKFAVGRQILGKKKLA